MLLCLSALGCEPAPSFTAEAQDTPGAHTTQDTEELQSLRAFFDQKRVDLELFAVQSDTTTKGEAIIDLADISLSFEILLDPRQPSTGLHHALEAGPVTIGIRPSEIGAFQGALGEVPPTAVAEYLFDPQIQTVCGTRKLGALLDIEHNGHLQMALAWIHIRPSTESTLETSTSGLQKKKAKKVTGIKGAVTKSNKPTRKKEVNEDEPLVDCGDDWTLVGDPECNAGACARKCTVKIGQITVKGGGLIVIGEFVIPIPIREKQDIDGHVYVHGECGVDYGWIYNSCACLAECPSE